MALSAMALTLLVVLVALGVYAFVALVIKVFR